MRESVNMNRDISVATERLSINRAKLLDEFPFFGRLLLRLQFGFANCGTAFTDMRRIVFDPEFECRLNDDELQFVLLHEIMHCVLKHCLRGQTLNHYLYNIACDIVVNSCILEIYHKKSFTVDGCKVIHKAPNGKEGNLYSAEEIYYMLLTADPDEIQKMYGGDGIDTHIIWDRILDGTLSDLWDHHIRDASKIYGKGSGIPKGLKRYLKQINKTPKTNWRQLLHDYIQNDRSDFVYEVPDHRYQDDVIMPSFQTDVIGAKADNLWFLIDTSGSISDAALTEAYSEIYQAVMQIDTLEGLLSFFDATVSEPVAFDSIEKLSKIEPVGGGGTSFTAIFEYMKQNMQESLPKLLIIMTDGYCDFPDESVTMGVPVIWVIVDSEVNPPWGECVHIEI